MLGKERPERGFRRGWQQGSAEFVPVGQQGLARRGKQGKDQRRNDANTCLKPKRMPLSTSVTAIKQPVPSQPPVPTVPNPLIAGSQIPPSLKATHSIWLGYNASFPDALPSFPEPLEHGPAPLPILAINLLVSTST